MYPDDVSDEVDIDLPEEEELIEEEEEEWEEEEEVEEADDCGDFDSLNDADDEEDESEDDRGNEGDLDFSLLTGFLVGMEGDGEGSKFSPDKSPKSKLFEDFPALDDAGTAFGACNPSRLIPERSPKLRVTTLPFPLLLIAFLPLILAS